MKRIIFRYNKGEYKQAEINQNTPISFNYNWMDFKQLDKRYVPGSGTIKFPPSPANKEIFGYFDNAGIDLGFVRSQTVGVELYFDALKLLKGRFNLQEYDNGYNGFITNSSSIIDAVNDKTITEILDASTLTASFANIGLALTYFNDLSTDGWLIPITYGSDSNATTTPHYVNLKALTALLNDIWRSTSKFIEDIETETGIPIYVYENSGLVAFSSSNLFTTSRYHYFPVFRYGIEEGTGITVDTLRGSGFYKRFRSVGPVLESAEFVDLPVDSPFDFLKLYSQYFNLGMYIDNDLERIVLVNYTDLYDPIVQDLDWSDKLVSFKKRASVSNYEKLNYIKYTQSGSASDEDTQVTVTNLNAYWLKPEKDIYRNRIIPGPLLSIEGGRDDLIDPHYIDNSAFSKSPCFMKRGTYYFPIPISLGSLTSTLNGLYSLEFDNQQSRYDYIDDMLAIGEEYDISFNLNLFDLSQIKPWSRVLIKRLGGVFHVNKINPFDPYNSNKASANIVKIK